MTQVPLAGSRRGRVSSEELERERVLAGRERDVAPGTGQVAGDGGFRWGVMVDFDDVRKVDARDLEVRPDETRGPLTRTNTLNGTNW